MQIWFLYLMRICQSGSKYFGDRWGNGNISCAEFVHCSIFWENHMKQITNFLFTSSLKATWKMDNYLDRPNRVLFSRTLEIGWLRDWYQPKQALDHCITKIIKDITKNTSIITRKKKICPWHYAHEIKTCTIHGCLPRELFSSKQKEYSCMELCLVSFLESVEEKNKWILSADLFYRLYLLTNLYI